MARTGNPKFTWQVNLLHKTPPRFRGRLGNPNRKILSHAPAQCSICPDQSFPSRPRILCTGKNQSMHRAAADQPIVPAEIMIENEVKGGRLASLERTPGAVLDFCFKTASTKRSKDASIGKEDRLRPALLRAGAARARNNPQGKWTLLF